MQEEIITLREDVALKDVQIQGFVKRIQDLRADIVDEDEEVIKPRGKEKIQENRNKRE